MTAPLINYCLQNYTTYYNSIVTCTSIETDFFTNCRTPGYIFKHNSHFSCILTHNILCSGCNRNSFIFLTPVLLVSNNIRMIVN